LKPKEGDEHRTHLVSHATHYTVMRVHTLGEVATFKPHC